MENNELIPINKTWQQLRYLEWLFLAVHSILAIADGNNLLPFSFAIYIKGSVVSMMNCKQEKNLS